MERTGSSKTGQSMGTGGAFFPNVGSGFLLFLTLAPLRGSSNKHNVRTLHARARLKQNVGTLHARARSWNKRDASTLHTRASSPESKCEEAPQGHDLRSKM